MIADINPNKIGAAIANRNRRGSSVAAAESSHPTERNHRFHDLLQTILHKPTKIGDSASPVKVFPDRQRRVGHCGIDYEVVVSGCCIAPRASRRTV
jgi:hypothetical protein